MFPEGELHRDGNDSKQRRQPRGRDAQPKLVRRFAVALVARAVVWKNGDGARELDEREESAHCGKNICCQRNQMSREPTDRISDEVIDGCYKFRLPSPT